MRVGKRSWPSTRIGTSYYVVSIFSFAFTVDKVADNVSQERNDRCLGAAPSAGR